MLELNLSNLYLGVAGLKIPIIIVILIIGNIASVSYLFLRAKKLGLSYKALALMYMLFFIFGNALSRLLFFLSHIFLHHDFQIQLKVFGFFTSGKISFGALAGVVLGVLAGAYLLKIRDKYQYLDLFLLNYVIMLFFTRVGDAIIHYHVGAATNLPIGFYYMGALRHEPSLYEAVSLGILFLYSHFSRSKFKKPGDLSLFIFAWMSLSRFLTDFFRVKGLQISNYQLFWNISLTQLTYLTIFCVLIYIIYRGRKTIIYSQA